MFGFDPGPPPTLIKATTDSEGKLQFSSSHELSASAPVAIALSENDVLRKILPLTQDLNAYFADFTQPLVFGFTPFDENHIMVMAASEETLKKLLAAVPASLQVCAIDHESYAIARALKKLGHVTQEPFGFCYAQQGKIKTSFFNQNHLTFYDESAKKEIYPEYKNITVIKIENKPYLLALGLALRNDSDLNILPKPTESAVRTHFRGIFFVIRCVIYSIALWAFAHVALTSLVFSQKKYNQFLHYELQKSMNETGTVQSQKTQIKTMQSQLQTLAKLKQQQEPSLTLLTSLSQVMPDGTFLTALAFHNNQLQLTGLAVTEDQTKTLMTNLGKLKNIEHPILNNVQPDNSEPPYHFSFSISATLGSPS